MFSIDLMSYYDKFHQLVFPSPLGDYVFNLHVRFHSCYVLQFPSPLGDYVFNLEFDDIMATVRHEVSVPSRGLCFQSHYLDLLAVI